MHPIQQPEEDLTKENVLEALSGVYADTGGRVVFVDQGRQRHRRLQHDPTGDFNWCFWSLSRPPPGSSNHVSGSGTPAARRNACRRPVRCFDHPRGWNRSADARLFNRYCRSSASFARDSAEV